MIGAMWITVLDNEGVKINGCGRVGDACDDNDVNVEPNATNLESDPKTPTADGDENTRLEPTVDKRLKLALECSNVVMRVMASQTDTSVDDDDDDPPLIRITNDGCCSKNEGT